MVFIQYTEHCCICMERVWEGSNNLIYIIVLVICFKWKLFIWTSYLKSVSEVNLVDWYLPISDGSWGDMDSQESNLGGLIASQWQYKFSNTIKTAWISSLSFASCAIKTNTIVILSTYVNIMHALSLKENEWKTFLILHTCVCWQFLKPGSAIKSIKPAKTMGQ